VSSSWVLAREWTQLMGHVQSLQFHELQEQADLYIPEWNAKILLRGVSRDEYEAIRVMATNSVSGTCDDAMAWCLLISQGSVNPRIPFTIAMNMPWPLVDRLVDTILGLSRWKLVN
jgi:hypothetical protein